MSTLIAPIDFRRPDADRRYYYDLYDEAWWLLIDGVQQQSVPLFDAPYIAELVMEAGELRPRGMVLTIAEIDPEIHDVAPATPEGNGNPDQDSRRATPGEGSTGGGERVLTIGSGHRTAILELVGRMG